jgi:hypothetical protein
MIDRVPADTQTRDARPRDAAIFASLVGLTSLGVLVQAVLAGEFIGGQSGGWVDAHAATADVLAVLSLATAVYATYALRVAARELAIASAILFVLIVAQTVIGHAITQNGDDWLTPIHVPLAMVIFGLAIWLSMRARTLRG